MSDAVMVPGLRDAAQAVVDRWETPLWKDVEPTAHVIARLRQALAASTPVGGWEDISTAPKDGTPIIGWCVHSANEYHLKDGYLTTYGSHVEGLGHVGDGAHVLEWGGECDGDGDGYIPDWWFRVGSDFEEAANPTHWMPLPPPPSVSIDNGSRPQEAVPTEQAVPPVVDCWKVGDYAERIEDHPLVKAGEVHEVVKMYRGGYLGFPRPVGGEWNPNGWRKVATPQPADGSSNEGAGE